MSGVADSDLTKYMYMAENICQKKILTDFRQLLLLATFCLQFLFPCVHDYVVDMAAFTKFRKIFLHYRSN